MRGGLLLIAAALLLTGYNLWDDWRAGNAAQDILDQIRELQQIQSDNLDQEGGTPPDYILNPDMEMPVTEIDGNLYIGTLEIPALGLSLPIMSDWSYPNLRIAPCRYEGTAYKGNFVVAAHNYQTHFGTLGRLSSGDQIIFTDVDGNTFYYETVEIQILKPTAIEEMTANGWDLSLFTCTLGGQTRLTVRCEKLTDMGTGLTDN